MRDAKRLSGALDPTVQRHQRRPPRKDRDPPLGLYAARRPSISALKLRDVLAMCPAALGDRTDNELPSEEVAL
jgi:hypothetical protein